MAASAKSPAPEETAEIETNNPLSEREMDVARLLVTGATNSEIAQELTISPNTVKVHLRNVFEKLQVASRTEASTLLLQRGWVVMPGLDLAEPTIEQPTPGPHSEPSKDATAIPTPGPLADQPATPAPWQQLYLLVALCLGGLALFLPSVFSFAQPELDLLSDVNAAALGNPVILMEERWDGRASLLQGRSRMASTQLNATIYVIGGESYNGTVLNTVEIFDLNLNRWQEGAPLPQALSNAAAAVHAGRIYVAGGSIPAAESNQQSLAVSDALWMYEPGEEAWQQVGTLPNPLAGMALVATDEALYLLGGWDGQAMRDEVWRWVPPASAEDPVPSWSLVSRLAVARAFLGAALLNGKIYVVGGFDGQRELNNADAYVLATSEWETLPPLTVARGGLSVVSDGTAIYALGGGWTRAMDTHERFNPDADVWSNIVSPISGEWRHLAGASYQGSLHVIGGWGGDYLDAHLRYESSIRSFLLPLIRTD